MIHWFSLIGSQTGTKHGQNMIFTLIDGGIEWESRELPSGKAKQIA